MKRCNGIRQHNHYRSKAAIKGRGGRLSAHQSLTIIAYQPCRVYEEERHDVGDDDDADDDADADADADADDDDDDDDDADDDDDDDDNRKDKNKK